MIDHFRVMALYNRWANERLYRAAAALSEADYLADLGAFFGGVSGTLNHLVVTDRVWMRRFTGEGPVQTRLDEILTPDLAELAELRKAEDARIIGYVEQLGEADLRRPITYSPISQPGAMTQSLGSALPHVFNHQTHHRGQATALLTRLGGRNGVESLDLLAFQRATGVGLQ